MSNSAVKKPYVYYRFEVYLCHEWGLEKKNPELYAKFDKVKEFFRMKKMFRVWDSEKDITNPDIIPHRIVAAMKCTRQVLVFITKDYIPDTCDRNKIAGKELRYCCMHDHDMVHFAYLDDEVKDISANMYKDTMFEEIFKERLENLQLLNLTDLSDENLDAQFKLMYQRIEKHIKDHPDD